MTITQHYQSMKFMTNTSKALSIKVELIIIVGCKVSGA